LNMIRLAQEQSVQRWWSSVTKLEEHTI